MEEQKNELSIKTQDGILDYATQYINKNNIIVGKNYNIGKAMNALYLNLIQSVNPKTHARLLDTCTPESIKEAITYCVDKELNVSKNQGYFVAYGSKLQFQPSYFGLMKMARDVANVVIKGKVFREGEQIDTETRIDGALIIHHKPNVKCLDNKILGAYAVATDISTGRVVDSEIMSKKQIEKAKLKSPSKWSMTQDFESEMDIKTVIRRLAKKIINSSSDTQEILITNADGTTTSVSNYNELLDGDEGGFDYTINASDEVDKEKKYEPKEEDTITADDLKLDTIESVDATPVIPENAVEIDYNLVRGGANKDKFKIIPNTFDKTTYTCMAIVLNDEGKALLNK